MTSEGGEYTNIGREQNDIGRRGIYKYWKGAG